MTYFGRFFWTLTKNELILHSRGINFPPRPKTMAKGTAMGLWKGKKGSSVFYRIANSNSAQKQGIRERAYEIANPRTTSQAGQRMKLLPAQRVYGVLKPIISRGWQGVKYGVESKQEFLKRALKLTTGYPYLEKDSDLVVPGEYQISKGTIQQIITKLDPEGDPDIHLTSLKGAQGLPGEETIGSLSATILSENPMIKEGDQLTIVGCSVDSSGSAFNWDWKSIIIDTTDTTEFGNSDFVRPGIIYFDPDPNNQQGNVYMLKTSSAVLVASAVIISRVEDGEYYRSTAKLTINSERLDGYFNGAAYRRARNSYMNPTRMETTDWPVEPELPENSYISDYALSGLTGNKAQCNGIVVLVTRNEETDALTGVFVSQYLGGDALVKKDGTTVTYETGSGGDIEEHAITPADQADLANLPTIPYE